MKRGRGSDDDKLAEHLAPRKKARSARSEVDLDEIPKDAHFASAPIKLGGPAKNAAASV